MMDETNHTTGQRDAVLHGILQSGQRPPATTVADALIANLRATIGCYSGQIASTGDMTPPSELVDALARVEAALASAAQQNLACPSVRARLAAQWGYVPALAAVQEPMTPEQITAASRAHPAEDLCGWSYRMGVADAERHYGIAARAGGQA